MSLLNITNTNEPSTRHGPTSENMHERGFAGPIVADDAHTLALPNVEANPRQRFNGTERFFDAVKLDNWESGIRHGHHVLRRMPFLPEITSY